MSLVWSQDCFIETSDGELLEDKSRSEIESFAQKMRQFFTHIDDSDDDEGCEALTAGKVTESEISIRECVHDKNDVSNKYSHSTFHVFLI